MSSRITKADLDQFMPGLADEVITAAVHYNLYTALRNSIGEYEREFNESAGFWSLTLNAHLMTARSALFRAYDRSPDGLNLPRLIEVVGQHSKMNKAELETDRKSVSSKDDPLVRKFIWQRNNLFAHKNWKNVAGGRAPELRNVLTKKEFQTLLQRAVDILNKYDKDLRRHTWSTNMIGGDDYKGVLKAVRVSIEVHEQKIQAEIDRYRDK